MSKIVCEVCGTAYPDTAPQCPICGNAKTDAVGTSGDTAAADGGYAYLKGGRFSHANVRKRNSGKAESPRTMVPAKPVNEKPAPKEPENAPEVQEPVKQEIKNDEPEMKDETQKPAPVMTPPPRRRRSKKKDGLSSNKGLLIIVILLILAILAVCAFIVVRLLDLNSDPTVPSGSSTTTQSSPTSSSTVPLPTDIPCTGVRVQMPSYTFDTVGQTLLLDVNKEPKDTTDTVSFESSDPYIASVDENGVIVAVAKGTVVITVRCGDQSTTCEIACNLENEPAYPTEPPETTPTQPTAPSIPVPPAPSSSSSTTKPFVKLELNRSDFTLSGYGSTHNLYSGELDPASITWTSSDEKVATVESGLVTAVGNGMALITAEYEGQRQTCYVHCNNAKKPSFSLSHTDITIYVGSKFTLTAYLENEDGTKAKIDPSELKFSTAKEGFFTVDEKGTITGVKNNWNYKQIYKILYVEYKGEKLECIVRIKG